MGSCPQLFCCWFLSLHLSCFPPCLIPPSPDFLASWYGHLCPTLSSLPRWTKSFEAVGQKRVFPPLFLLSLYTGIGFRYFTAAMRRTTNIGSFFQDKYYNQQIFKCSEVVDVQVPSLGCEHAVQSLTVLQPLQSSLAVVICGRCTDSQLCLLNPVILRCALCPYRVEGSQVLCALL